MQCELWLWLYIWLRNAMLWSSARVQPVVHPRTTGPYHMLHAIFHITITPLIRHHFMCINTEEEQVCANIDLISISPSLPVLLLIPAVRLHSKYCEHSDSDAVFFCKFRWALPLFNFTNKSPWILYRILRGFTSLSRRPDAAICLQCWVSWP